MTGSSASRVVFLDLARALAVLLMVQGHTIDALLITEHRWSVPYNAWLFIRGLTSCTFLFLSGAAFSLTATRHWDDQRRWSDRVRRRLRRFTFFLALGYLVHFPMGRFWHLPFATDEAMRSFLAVDVLQNTAAALLLLQALVVVSPTPRVFARAASAIGCLVALATPWVHAVDWTPALPLLVSSYLSHASGSLFPMFPWATYAFVGAAFGVRVARLSAAGDLEELPRQLFRVGGTLVIVTSLLAQLPFEPYSAFEWWRRSPVHVALRIGCVLLLLSGISALAQRLRHLAAPLQALAEESLLVYAVHVAVLYGSLWNVGLNARFGPLSPGRVAAWCVVMMTGATVLAWAWSALQHHTPRLAQATRWAVMTALLLPLILP